MWSRCDDQKNGYNGQYPDFIQRWEQGQAQAELAKPKLQLFLEQNPNWVK
jgi:hypothetical protein